jgi:enoyl-CoA hydratase/carnithine racemase
MGLCGARIKASWALELGLVDNVFRKGLASEVSRCIQADSLIDEPLLASATQEDLQEMRAISKIIEPLQLMSSIGEFHEWVMHSRDTLKHPYILACLETYLKGSRLSSFITWRLFEWSLGKSVEECFEMDLELSRLLGKDLDFHEGVRALLIDKDKSPKFRFNSYETIEESFVMPF